MSQTAPEQPIVIRLKLLTTLLGTSRSSIYSMMDPRSPSFDPTFPKPVRLGKRTIGWLSPEVSGWLQSRPRARNNVKGEEA